MRTERLDGCPVPRRVTRENAMMPVIRDFVETGDQYHQVMVDGDTFEYERYASQLRSAVRSLGLEDDIKVHNTFVYDDRGRRRGRMLWLENTTAG